MKETLARVPAGLHVHFWAGGEYAGHPRVNSADSTNWFRDAWNYKNAMPFLTPAECVELVVKRYQRERRKPVDPATTPDIRERYQHAFGSLLAHREAQIQSAIDGRSEAQAAQTLSAEEERRLADELLVADVAAAMNHGWPVDQSTLERAADAYARIKAQAASEAKPETRKASR